MTLRDIIEAAGGTLDVNTVLAAKNDPYRLDTPAGHVLGQWFKDQLALHPGRDGKRHLRGLHYALLNPTDLGPTVKPDGKRYSNSEADWEWLSQKASKAARWLKYVPFDTIVDERNDEPIIRVHKRNRGEPRGYLNANPTTDVGETDINFDIYAGLENFHSNQPYRLAIFGEKSSLDPIVGPIAERVEADLYLGTGEPSDTHLHTMAREGADDGRKLIVFALTDFDPSGWQMVISISRKLQAFRDLLFPELEFEVHVVGLTLDQAIAFELPSEPLKETEKRGDDWRRAWGREQTEIDSLIELYPDKLRQIIEDAIEPYYDATLYSLNQAARHQWQAEAQAKVDEVFDSSDLNDLEAEAEEIIEQAKADLEEVRSRAEELTEGLAVELPSAPPLPIPDCPGNSDAALIDSAWGWKDGTDALIWHKRYGAGRPPLKGGKP